MNRKCVLRIPQARRKIIAAAIATSLTGSALAIEFKTDSGWSGSINTTLSYASSWRAESRDKQLVNGMNAVGAGWQTRYTDNTNNPFPANPFGGAGGLWFNGPFAPGTVKTIYEAAMAGYTGESKGSTGNMNYGKNDRYSEMYKVISDLSISKDGTGALVRVKGWYDNGLNNENAPWGNQANRFTTGKPLSDDGAPALNRFDGLELLDTYAYTSFDIGDNPAQVRVGRQALNWGESLFFQGVNQISPVDVSALRRAGTEIKEALLPIWAISGSIGLPAGTSLEAFYQAKWEPSSIDGCGTYWAGDVYISAHAGACNMIAAIGAQNSNATAYTSNSFAKFVNGREGSDDGQFGLAFRFPIAAIDTEFGVYAMQINSRTPVLSYRNATAFGPTPATLGTTAGFLEYPDNIKVYGLSAATTLASISWAAELSMHHDVPVQINTADLTTATGSYGRAGQVFGPAGALAAAAGLGGYMQGYERFDKWQLQLNGVGVLPAMLGATNGTVLGEVALQWNDLPDYKTSGNLRFGRAPEFGISPVSYNQQYTTFGTLTGASAAGVQCAETAFGPQFNQAGCKNDGYMTDFAWAYRLRAQLDYPNVFGAGITISPIVFFAHDVEGVSVDNQMNEGKKTFSFTLRMNKNKAHNLDFNYTTYSNSANYDPTRDRDNYSVAYSYTF
ncbi:MAG: DUF1302 domain-containing protein [Rhodocyclaceae bacterium]|nr:DUF1302 domain-containing protein [Rhodocyclaceae bacterium]